VGNFYPHKNVEFLIDAFAKIDTDVHLVLCGPHDYFSKKIDALVKEKSLEHKVSRISDSTLEERAYLYSHAIALIHPSMNEGFGLPLLEAAYFGCPAIVSDIPVFREVRPDATFFELGDMTGLAQLMENKVKDSNKRSKDRVSNDFSFKKMAEDTYNQYKQCI
jgi:glycosyltransferase involved in cell wall biosynthesis